MLILLTTGYEIYKPWVPKSSCLLYETYKPRKFAGLFLPLMEEHTLRRDSVVCIMTKLLDNPEIIVQFQAGARDSSPRCQQ
jgi:hypothetical protein